MIFEPRDKTKRMTVTFPKFTFDGNSLPYVKTFKHLGHIITDTFSDDDDIHREIRNMFIRTNILTRRFAKCSVDLKIILFRAYCILYRKHCIQSILCCISRRSKTAKIKCYKL